MSLHSDTISWFRANQSLLLLLNYACLVEKQEMPIVSSLWFDYHTRGEHANHYTIDVFEVRSGSLFCWYLWVIDHHYSIVLFIINEVTGLWCVTPCHFPPNSSYIVAISIIDGGYWLPRYSWNFAESGINIITLALLWKSSLEDQFKSKQKTPESSTALIQNT